MIEYVNQCYSGTADNRRHLDVAGYSSTGQREVHGKEDVFNHGRQPNGSSLPATAQRLIDLHKALIFVTLRLRQSELGIVERALAIEDFQIGGNASPVA